MNSPSGWLEWQWNYRSARGEWRDDGPWVLPGRDGRLEDWVSCIHPDDRLRVASALGGLVSGGSRLLEHRLMTRAGVWQWVANVVTAAPEADRQPTLRGLVVNPQSLSGPYLNAVQGVLSCIARATRLADAEEVVNETCAALVASGSFASAGGWLFEGPRVRQVAWVGAASSLAQQLNAATPKELVSAFGLLALWHSTDVANDVRAPLFCRACLESGTPGLGILPLRHDNELIGLIALCSSDRAPPLFDDPRLLNKLGEALSLSSPRDLGRMVDEAARYRSVFELATDAIFLADPHGQYTDANEAALRLVGYSLDELRLLTVRDLAPPDDPPRLAEVVARGSLVRERNLRARDGTLVRVDIGARVMPDGSFLSIARSLDARSRFESQLQLTDRLVSLGTLAGGVAHELNNPLSWIISNLSQAREQLDKWGGTLPAEVRTEFKELLAESLEGANRIVTVVSDLRTFTRTDSPSTNVPLPRVLDRVAKMLAIQARYRGQIVLNFGVTPEVLGSESQLTQLFVNLLLNAVQALPEGRPDQNRVDISTYTDLEGNALVELRDTGVGITPESLRHIFDPFFTTKPVGVGTGLGLTVVFNIVTQLGGTIEVDSAPGEGTRVRVKLPAAQASAGIDGQGHR